MRRIADLTLAGLADLPTAERHMLLQTFGAWLDHDGSAARAAEQLRDTPTFSATCEIDNPSLITANTA